VWGAELRIKFEHESRELQMQYEHRLERVRRGMFEARESDVKRIEARKAKHIAQLLAAHERAFADIKRYYQKITHNNLDTIKALKEECNDLSRKEALDEKKIVKIAQENKKLSGPLAQALDDARALRIEKEVYERELLELRDTKVATMEFESQLNTLRWEHEILMQRHKRLESERDELREKFTEALYEVQQKAGFRNLLLERKLEAADAEVEKRSAQLSEVLLQARLDPAAVGSMQDKLDDVLSAKDATIGELQGELERVVAAHNSLVDAFQTRLHERGIRPEELGFVPLRAEDVLRPLELKAGGETLLAHSRPRAAASGAGGPPRAPRVMGGGRAVVKVAVPPQLLNPSVLSGGPKAAEAAALVAGAT
jgi:growth arrest-specific protein 8